jgi:hypothetical protein
MNGLHVPVQEPNLHAHIAANNGIDQRTFGFLAHDTMDCIDAEILELGI